MSRSTRIASAAVMVAGLAACSDDNRPAPQDQNTAATQGAGTADAATITSDTTPDRAAETSPRGAGPLPPEVPSTYYADLAEMAEGLGVKNPPDVQPIRAVSLDDIDQVQADCLTEQGIPAKVEPGGGVSFGGTVEQEEAMNLAQYVCFGQYPLAQEYTQPLSTDQLQIYYDWMLQESLPCIDDLGYPTPEPPSFETFVAGYEANKTLFFADTALDQATLADDMHTIMDSCEILPPDELLYGAP